MSRVLPLLFLVGCVSYPTPETPPPIPPLTSASPLPPVPEGSPPLPARAFDSFPIQYSLPSHRPHWPRRELTWTVKGAASPLSEDQTHSVFTQALEAWASGLPLRFHYTASESADLVFSFGDLAIDTPEHRWPALHWRDGPAARCFGPPSGLELPLHGDCQINTAWRWTETTLLASAVHWVGHSVGVAHSIDPADVMFPLSREDAPLVPSDNDFQSYFNATDDAPASSDVSSTDSDGDGLSDGEERLIWFTDPRNPDTDGDGLLDNEALHNSHPLLRDSDHDGRSDREEVLAGTQPMISDRTPHPLADPWAGEWAGFTDESGSLSLSLDSDGQLTGTLHLTSGGELAAIALHGTVDERLVLRFSGLDGQLYGAARLGEEGAYGTLESRSGGRIAFLIWPEVSLAEPKGIQDHVLFPSWHPASSQSEPDEAP